ncbi:MAG: HD domain-containing protein [Chitinophagales bacterium]
MSYDEAGKAVEDYITSLFQLNPSEIFVYHNFEHTRKVAGRADEIALFYKIDQKHLFIIRTAAWFHDIGYLFTGPKEHERESVRLMEEFISDIISIRPLIEEIKQCIMATKRIGYPVSVEEKIICDADTYHFGTPEFKQTDPLIRKEVELLAGSVQTGWIGNSIKLLRNHQFYTSYCKERLDAGKEQNIAWLESLL